MLPKKNRLVKKNNFNEIFQKGEFFKNGPLIFRTLKSRLKESRFGFVVSKKVSNKANQRNKIKRILRSAVLKNLKEVKKPFDVVVIALPGALDTELSDIQEAIDKFFKKIK